MREQALAKSDFPERDFGPVPTLQASSTRGAHARGKLRRQAAITGMGNTQPAVQEVDQHATLPRSCAEILRRVQDGVSLGRRFTLLPNLKLCPLHFHKVSCLQPLDRRHKRASGVHPGLDVWSFCTPCCGHRNGHLQACDGRPWALG